MDEDVRETGMDLRDLLGNLKFVTRTGKNRDCHQRFDALRL